MKRMMALVLVLMMAMAFAGAESVDGERFVTAVRVLCVENFGTPYIDEVETVLPYNIVNICYAYDNGFAFFSITRGNITEIWTGGVFEVMAFVMVIEEYMDVVTQYPVTIKLTNLTDAI